MGLLAGVERLRGALHAKHPSANEVLFVSCDNSEKTIWPFRGVVRGVAPVSRTGLVKIPFVAPESEKLPIRREKSH